MPGGAQRRCMVTTGVPVDVLGPERLVNRALELAVWGLPAVSTRGIVRSIPRDLGGTFNDVIYTSAPLEPRHAFLTANNQTPYVATTLNLRDGPAVLELPPVGEKAALFGSAVNAWQRPIVDVGPMGEDAGRGGKYLFLPPGYGDDVPDGYFPVPMDTYTVLVALRPIARNGGTLGETVAYARTMRVYPLGQPEAAGRYIDAFPLAWDTLPRYDLSFWQELAAVIDEEPLQAHDAAMLGLAASLGIEQGVPFSPDGAVSAALAEGVQGAYGYLRHALETPGGSFRPFWPDRRWGEFALTEKADFTFLVDGKLLIDERAFYYYWATMLPRKLGAGTFYLASAWDNTGQLLAGTKRYRLLVPANPPARDFWSVIVYSRQTNAFIRGDGNRVGLSSYDAETLEWNPDGSVELFFGPQPPAGKAANWIPTANEDFFLLFRFYGPEKALFAKTWTLPDVEGVR